MQLARMMTGHVAIATYAIVHIVEYNINMAIHLVFLCVIMENNVSKAVLK